MMPPAPPIPTHQVPIPFPAAVLIRPKALVVNLETVRMLICSNQCYVLSGEIYDVEGSAGGACLWLCRHVSSTACMPATDAGSLCSHGSPCGPACSTYPPAGCPGTPTLVLARPVRAVPKAGDPHVATLPTLDSPFIQQLCRCLRSGKSTATMHDLSRWAHCGLQLATV